MTIYFAEMHLSRFDTARNIAKGANIDLQQCDRLST